MRCEITICICWEHHRELKAALKYDKRTSTNSARGRALICDIRHFGLEKGDRLEPSGFLRNIASFDTLAMFPVTVSFWRRSTETLARHRCPLTMADIGVSISRCLTLDSLHTLAFGVYGYFCGDVVQKLFSADFWNVGDTSHVARRQLSTLRLRGDLFAWCSDQKCGGNKHIHAVADLTAEMFGTKDSPSCKLQGAATNTHLQFIVELLQTNAGRVEHGADLVRIGPALLKMHFIPKNVGDIFSPLSPSVLQDHRIAIPALHPITKNALST